MNTQNIRLTTLSKAEAKKIVSAKFGKLGLLTILINLVTAIPMFIVGFANVMNIISNTMNTNVFGMITSAISLALTTIISTLLIATPMILGQVKCFYDVYKTGDFQWKTMLIAFETLESYKRALKYGILMFVKLLVLFIPFFIAIYIAIIQFSFIIFGLLVYGDFIFSAMMILIGLLILIAALIIGIIIKSIKYYAGYLTLIDNQEIGCKGAMKQGVEIFRGYNKELIYFGFSFTLWYILSVITSGVVTFFTLPYMIISLITLVHNIQDEKEEKAIQNVQDVQENTLNIEIQDTNDTTLENISNLGNKELDLVNQKLENKKEIDN